ncbi:MAG TPA: prolipoprotein diacylglyceryl transferase family protein [Actinomycetota bacterium]|nr:prolipoprotein diacylglyceryl transferase family protein [Actinomycetota bacterium]
MIPYKTFPVFHVGPVAFHTFGVFVGLGMLVGAWVFVRHGRRAGMDAEELGALAWWILIAGFVGARLMYVIAHIGDFVSRPWAVVAVWEGGLEFSGGFIAAVAVVLWWLRRHRDVPGLTLADGVVLGLAPGLAIGRIGCYSVGEHLGGSTSFPLAVHYLGGVTREGPIAIGAHIHNTALYEILLLLPLIALLFWLRHRGVGPGWLTVTFLLWYGVQRFCTDFLRAYDRTVLGLTGAQYLCIVLVGAGLVLMTRIRRSSQEADRLPSAAPAEAH